MISFASQTGGPAPRERAARVKLVIFDVDGVLTDGGIYVGQGGELFKPFHVRDGMGITLAHRAGLQTAIITGRASALQILQVILLPGQGIVQKNLLSK